MAGLTESNRQMTGIVEEFEKTIQQLIREKERSQVVAEIERERALTERNQIFEDLQAVERAFTDLHRKYERTKEVIADGYATEIRDEDGFSRDICRLYWKILFEIINNSWQNW